MKRSSRQRRNSLRKPKKLTWNGQRKATRNRRNSLKRAPKLKRTSGSQKSRNRLKMQVRRLRLLSQRVS